MLHELDVTSEVLQAVDTSMKDKEDKDKERCKGFTLLPWHSVGTHYSSSREHLGGDKTTK